MCRFVAVCKFTGSVQEFGHPCYSCRLVMQLFDSATKVQSERNTIREPSMPALQNIDSTHLICTCLGYRFMSVSSLILPLPLPWLLCLAWGHDGFEALPRLRLSTSGWRQRRYPSPCREMNSCLLGVGVVHVPSSVPVMDPRKNAPPKPSP